MSWFPAREVNVLAIRLYWFCIQDYAYDCWLQSRLFVITKNKCEKYMYCSILLDDTEDEKFGYHIYFGGVTIHANLILHIFFGGVTIHANLILTQMFNLRHCQSLLLYVLYMANYIGLDEVSKSLMCTKLMLVDYITPWIDHFGPQKRPVRWNTRLLTFGTGYLH